MIVKAEKWTVQVHGDMTVMNKEELAKLNEVYQGKKFHFVKYKITQK